MTKRDDQILPPSTLRAVDEWERESEMGPARTALRIQAARADRMANRPHRFTPEELANAKPARPDLYPSHVGVSTMPSPVASSGGRDPLELDRKLRAQLLLPWWRRPQFKLALAAAFPGAGMTDADEAWMVWLTSAEVAETEEVICDCLGVPRSRTFRALAKRDFEAWIDALMVGRDG